MDEELLDALEKEAERLRALLVDARVQKVAGQLNYPEWTEAFYRPREKLHAIARQLQNPDALVVWNARVRGFKLSGQTDVAALTKALESRGLVVTSVTSDTIEFTSAGGWPFRTYDSVVVDGPPNNLKLTPDELKTTSEFLKSVEGPVSSPRVRQAMEAGQTPKRLAAKIQSLATPTEGEFKAGSRLGRQLRNEKWLNAVAIEHQVEAVIVDADDLLPDKKGATLEVKPRNLALSRPAAYQLPSKDLFAKLRKEARRRAIAPMIRSVRLKRRRPKVRRTQRPGPQGVNNKLVDNRMVNAAEDALETGVKTSRFARAGAFALNALLPDPSDALMLGLDVILAYDEARQNMAADSFLAGFSDGVAASLLEWRPEQVDQDLREYGLVRDIETLVLSAVTVREDNYNIGLNKGYRYAHGAPDNIRQLLLSARPAGPRLAKETVFTFARGLRGVVKKVFQEEERKRLEELRREYKTFQRTLGRYE